VRTSAKGAKSAASSHLLHLSHLSHPLHPFAPFRTLSHPFDPFAPVLTSDIHIQPDDFLSRYAPGGAMAARYELLQVTRFPGMQPFGNYPIHVIVRNGRTTLVGLVDNESDRILAGVRARDVSGVFGVENELEVRTK
jgi:hypothetical protein